MLISIILPTYNERENIRRLIPKIEQELKHHRLRAEILVVDDTSPDGTAAVARKLNKRYGNIRALVRPKKEGIGAALRDGYHAAKGDVLVSIDVDSMEPSVIPRLVKKLEEGYDLVNGSRGILGKSYQKNSLKSYMKETLSLCGNFVLRTLFQTKLTHLSMNCRAVRKRAWRAIQTKEKGNLFLIEMIVQLKKKNYRITQIPIKFVDRKYGETKMQLGRQSFRFFLVIGRLAWQYWFR